MRRSASRRVLVVLGLTVAFLSTTVVAHAYWEGSTPDDRTCEQCHGEGTNTWALRYGPHGEYSPTTRRCELCHMLHDANGNKLLPAETITKACQTCHDYTGGTGVYGGIVAGGEEVLGGHRCDATSTVPGGDAATGGPRQFTFRGGTSGTLGCSDCHSPHKRSVVASFPGDRPRVSGISGAFSTRLLKRRPNNISYDISEYGSDWCAACHQGRMSGGVVQNHPVESSTTPGAFNYSRVAIVKSLSSKETTYSHLARSHLGFVMPAQRTPEQAGHAPICQQCHEDARRVGVPGAALQFSVNDRYAWDKNPKIANFPHETLNPRMLVETDDDLCTNCHDPGLLP